MPTASPATSTSRPSSPSGGVRKSKLSHELNTADVASAITAAAEDSANKTMSSSPSAAKQDKSIYVDDSGQRFSTVERILSHVPPPCTTIPHHEQIFPPHCAPKPDYKFLQKHFISEGRLSETSALQIISQACEVFTKEPTLLEIRGNTTVCGDIHGQYFDLMKLFEVGGPPESTQYLFLGDYVDRGHYSIECFILLLSIKLCFPRTMYMLRGNHECRHLTEYFTFRMEAIHKYSEQVYEACLRAFNSLPLAAVVNAKFFCVHGGISPDVRSLDDIKRINRHHETPTFGPMCDLLWADPLENFDSEESMRERYVHNSVRGCSYFYTYRAACEFLAQTGMSVIIRAHEAQDAGHRMHKQNNATGLPSVITVFSAPNYLDVYNNKAAILRLREDTIHVETFAHSPHSYWLPNFMDVFTWSLPFVAEKITDMLGAVLATCTKAELTEAEPTDEERKKIIRNKILAVGRMARLYNLLRKEPETISELKGLLGTQNLPSGSLALGIEGIKSAINTFDTARSIDITNERLPPVKAENEAENPSEFILAVKENDSLVKSILGQTSPEKKDRQPSEHSPERKIHHVKGQSSARGTPPSSAKLNSKSPPESMESFNIRRTSEPVPSNSHTYTSKSRAHDSTKAEEYSGANPGVSMMSKLLNKQFRRASQDSPGARATHSTNDIAIINRNGSDSPKKKPTSPTESPNGSQNISQVSPTKIGILGKMKERRDIAK